MKLEEETQLEAEEEKRISEQINNICFINQFSSKEKDELWSLIWQLVENQIEIEEHCNQ